MRKKLILIFFCFSGSIFSVFLLYKISNKLNQRPNGFIRLFPPHRVYPRFVSDLTYNSYYIAGATRKNIYFGNHTTINYLLLMDYGLHDSSSIHIQFPSDTRLLVGSSEIRLDSPDIYIADGRIPVLYHSDFSNLLAKKMNHDSSVYFTDELPISKSSSVLKVFDRKLHESKMAKENLDSPLIAYESAVLQKQSEGLFSTDGLLNSNGKRLVYVYYYRNQIICLDTNLHILYRARTIDTIQHAQIQLTKINSSGITTFGSPPLTVNKHSCINDKWILVHSLLRANNEDEKQFDTCSVIDVYSLSDGLYHFSFYLPDYLGKKVTEFRIFNGYIVALYGRYAYIFLMNF